LKVKKEVEGDLKVKKENDVEKKSSKKVIED